MKIFFALFLLSITSNSTKAGVQEDQDACKAKMPELYELTCGKLKRSTYRVISIQIIDAYKQIGVILSDRELDARASCARDNSGYFNLIFEIRVNAGDDSSEFKVTGRTSGLYYKAEREVKLDPIGRVVSNQLACSMFTSANGFAVNTEFFNTISGQKFLAKSFTLEPLTISIYLP